MFGKVITPLRYGKVLGIVLSLSTLALITQSQPSFADRCWCVLQESGGINPASRGYICHQGSFEGKTDSECSAWCIKTTAGFGILLPMPPAFGGATSERACQARIKTLKEKDNQKRKNRK